MSKFYRYIPEYNRYSCLVADERTEDAINSLLGQSVDLNRWVCPQLTIEDEGRNGDFPGITGCEIPVFSSRAIECLKEELGETVQYLPVHVDGVANEYSIVNPLSVLDCIDSELSQFSTFSDGTISDIDNPVFREMICEYPHVFRILDYPRNVYITDGFRDLVKRHKLSGIKWVACK